MSYKLFYTAKIDCFAGGLNSMTELKQIFRAPEQYLEQEIEVAGWVRNIRASKKFGFIRMNFCLKKGAVLQRKTSIEGIRRKENLLHL